METLLFLYFFNSVARESMVAFMKSLEVRTSSHAVIDIKFSGILMGTRIGGEVGPRSTAIKTVIWKIIGASPDMKRAAPLLQDGSYFATSVISTEDLLRYRDLCGRDSSRTTCRHQRKPPQLT